MFADKRSWRLPQDGLFSASSRLPSVESPRMFRRYAAVIALVAATVVAPSLSAQWPAFPTPDVPRTADGKPDLLAPAPRTRDGKPDLSGIWENPGWSDLGNSVSGTGGAPGRPAVLPRGPGLFFDIGSGVPGGLPFQPSAAALKDSAWPTT